MLQLKLNWRLTVIKIAFLAYDNENNKSTL